MASPAAVLSVVVVEAELHSICPVANLPHLLPVQKYPRGEVLQALISFISTYIQYLEVYPTYTRYVHIVLFLTCQVVMLILTHNVSGLRQLQRPRSVNATVQDIAVALDDILDGSGNTVLA